MPILHLRHFYTLSLKRRSPLTRYITALAFAAFSLMAAAPTILRADATVTIQDTSGFTRAVSDVETTGKVEFTLVDTQGAAANGVPVTLTNTATSQTLTVTATQGTATFEGLAPGIWTVSTTAPGITFTNVAVVNAVAAAGIAGAGIGTGALIAGGTAAAAGTTIAISNSSSGDNGAALSPSF